MGFSSDGDIPLCGLIADKTGALYGTPATGGKYCSPYGCCTVFELKPSKSGYAYRVIHSLKGRRTTRQVLVGSDRGPRESVVRRGGLRWIG